MTPPFSLALMEYQYLLSIMCAVLVFAGKLKNIFLLQIQKFGLKNYFSINIMFTETRQYVPSLFAGICSMFNFGMISSSPLYFILTSCTSLLVS